MTNTPILEFRNLSKEYAKRDGSGTLKVLDGLTKTIHKGELVTLVGPSGCGKTTLLNSIMGTLKPTSGELLLDGKPITGPGSDRGVVYQKYSLFDHLTVIENVILAGTMRRPMFAKSFGYGDKIKADREKAMDILDRVSLADSAKKYPHELSGGMKQRVAIAQTLFAQPRILLMDEPFGALDEGTRSDAQRFLLELWEKENLTVIFITHALDEAVYMGSRLLALSQHWDGHNNGAKFVLDYDLSEQIGKRKTEDMTYKRYIAEFPGLIDNILNLAMDSDTRQSMETFHTGFPVNSLA